MLILIDEVALAQASGQAMNLRQKFYLTVNQ
jgi:hypothetical protein